MKRIKLVMKNLKAKVDSYVFHRDRKRRGSLGHTSYGVAMGGASIYDEMREGLGTYKSESNPLFKCVHGFSNEDWVTEWFLGWTTNLTVSPGRAV
jgi:hypothetical protein